MPTFPIHLEVEEIALGTVLRKLNAMPGIAKIDLNLGHGGQGAGKKQLQQAAAKARGAGTSEQKVVQLLMSGPKHIGEISAAVGGAKSRAYGAVHQLKKKGLAEAGPGSGMHQLTKRARQQLGGATEMPAAPALAALPAPRQVSHGPKGRATPGSGPIILRQALNAGPVRSSDLRRSLAESGMSTKSISGVLDRGKRHGIIKKNGADLYELTAKGLKIELGASTHG